MPAVWLKFRRLAQNLFNATATQDKPVKVQVKVRTRVLFVCMGNICRSPMAEGILRRMLEDAGLAGKVYVASAGTHSFHTGCAPDRRGQEIARRRGVELKAIRARQVEREDLEHFDYVLAMDRDNYEYLLSLSENAELRGKIQLLMDYAPALPEREVPDPYYGGLSGFERVMDLMEEATYGLLLHIRERYRI